MFRRINSHLDKNDKLLKHSLIIFIGATVANILNYVYQLIMGRLLGPEDYGILGALFSITYISMFAYGTIKTVLTQFSSAFYAKKEYGKIKSLFIYSIKKITLMGIISLAIYLLLTPFISSFLKIEDNWLIAIVGIFLFISLYNPIPIGILYGLQKFHPINIISILVPLVKFILGLLLVLLGYKVLGAMLGLALSQIIGFFASLFFLTFIFKYEKVQINNVEIFKYSIPVFASLIIINLFVNMDVLLVKHYFSAIEAGYYAAASVMGKIIMFTSSTFIIVMFPKVSSNHTSNKDSTKILRSTLFYTLLISAAGILLFYFIPTFISRVVFGDQYNIAGYIGTFGLIFGIYSLANVLVSYNLAVKKTSFIYYLLPLLLVEIIGIVIFHSSIYEILKVLLVVNIFMLLALVFLTRKELGL